MEGQHKKTPRMGITGCRWSRSTAKAGVHWKKLSRGHQSLLVCARGGREGNKPQHLYFALYIHLCLYSVHPFRGCLASTHLCCQQTPMKLIL